MFKVNNNMTKNPKWIYFNFNPWKAHIGDCAIRAISAATGLDYREVCKKLGVSYKNGHGLIRDTGIDLNDIYKVFGDYFDIVEDYYDNYAFTPDEFKGSKEDEEMRRFDELHGIDAVSKTTLNDFCDEFAGQGKFLVGLVGNPEAKIPQYRNKNAGHIVYVNLSPNAKRQGFVDNFDSGELLVDAYMRLNKVEPKSSPKHYKYDMKNHKFVL